MAEGFAAGFFLLWVIAILALPSGPRLTDYGNWTYQGVLLARCWRGITDPAHWLKPYPVPNSAATVGVGLLALALPWLWAAKVWLAVQLAVSYGTLRYLVRKVGADWALWGIVPPGIFFGINWWYGFMNFELGVCWAMLTAGMLLRRAQGEAGRDWVLGLLLVLAFFTHMIPFAFCGLLVVLYAWQTGFWRVLWQLVPVFLLTIWYLAGRYFVAGDADGQAGMAASVRDYSWLFWAFKVTSYAKSLGFVNPGSLDGSVALALFGKVGFFGLIALDLAMAALLGWCLVLEVQRAYRRGAPERFLWVGVMTLVPVFLVAPGTALGVSDPGSRLLQVVLALGMMLVSRHRSTMLRGAAACGVVLAVASLGMFVRIGFGPGLGAMFGAEIPWNLTEFGHVAFDDQVFFYKALDRGDYGLPVFPTGIFLNRAPKQ